jgi:hypothetical protein
VARGVPRKEVDYRLVVQALLLIAKERDKSGDSAPQDPEKGA